MKLRGVRNRISQTGSRVTEGRNMDMRVGASQNHRNAGLTEKQDAQHKLAYLTHAEG